jgi:hypothetical protein
MSDRKDRRWVEVQESGPPDSKCLDRIFDNSDETLEKVAFDWGESVFGDDDDDDPIRTVLARIDKIAALAISMFVKEVKEDKEDLAPDSLRPLIRSSEALASVDDWLAQDDPEVNRRIQLFLYAVAALTYTEICREEIEAGVTEPAVLVIHRANQCKRSISRWVVDYCDERRQDEFRAKAEEFGRRGGKREVEKRASIGLRGKTSTKSVQRCLRVHGP